MKRTRFRSHEDQIKTEEQQGVLFLLRARDLVVPQWTQLSNMLRGLLGEFGKVMLLRTIPGVGPVTGSAIVATAGDGHQFRNGREFAA